MPFWQRSLQFLSMSNNIEISGRQAYNVIGMTSSQWMEVSCLIEMRCGMSQFGSMKLCILLVLRPYLQIRLFIYLAVRPFDRTAVQPCTCMGEQPNGRTAIQSALDIKRTEKSLKITSKGTMTTSLRIDFFKASSP